MFHKVIKTACILISAAVLYIIVNSFLTPAGTDERITINYNGETVRGEFDGDVIEGKAAGEGVFKGASEEGELIIQSTFENGRMEGDARITLPDGTELSGEMKSGFWEGVVSGTKNNELSERMRFDYGLPDGCFVSFEKGRTKEYSWYNQGINVMEAFSQTDESSTGDLYRDVYGLLGEIIRITGKVVTITKDEGIWILLADESGETIPICVSDYNEEEKSRTLSCSLKTGDQVEILGRLQSRKTLVSYANMQLVDEIYVDAILILGREEEADISSDLSNGKPGEAEELFRLWDLKSQITGTAQNVRFDFDRQVYMYDVLCGEDSYQITGSMAEEEDIPVDGKTVEIDGLRIGIRYDVDTEGNMIAISVLENSDA